MADRLAALDGTLDDRQPAGRRDARDGGDPVRVVIGEDSLLLREGIARVLEAAGIEVVALAGDLDGLLAAVDRDAPDVAVVDIRMPPTHTDEGLRAARRIRADAPARPACSCSPSTSTRTTSSRCSATAPRASATCSRTASPTATRSSTPSAASPPARPRSTRRSSPTCSAAAARGGPLEDLTERERTVLGEMAEGRSNPAIAAGCSSPTARSSATSPRSSPSSRSTATPETHRRVLAVLTYLRA